MANRQQFGLTWWGSQWLNSLNQIDFDNRLPRGRSYANKGAVTELQISGSQIKARVQGSRFTPYKVTVSVPSVSRELVEVLLDEIGTHPAAVAKILNRELDPMVLEFSNEKNIPIFPSRWSDIDMKCSCPDWAVPCKHIAAVIYLVAKQIDGNPFLVFSLRGIDLVEEMKARDVLIEDNEDLGIPNVANLFRQNLQGGPLESSITSATPHQVDSNQIKTYKDLDYSKLPDLKESLIQVLADNPAFCTGTNFKNTYQKLLSKTAKSASLQLAITERSTSQAAIGTKDKPKFVIDADYRLHIEGIPGVTSLDELIAAISALHEDDLFDFQPEISDTYHVYMSSLQLVAHGAVIPEIFKSGSHFVIRWLPALLDEEVTLLITALSALINRSLVTFEDHENPHPPDSGLSAITLVSLFIDKLISTFSCANSEKPQRDDIVGLFFGGQRTKFDRPGQGSIAKGISIWLTRLHISKSDYLPVLMVTEQRNDFALSIAIEEPSGPSHNPVPLSKVMSQKKWEGTRFSILQKISLLAEFFPAFHDYISTAAKIPISISIEEITDLLFDVLPIMRLMGLKTSLPKSLDKILRPRLSAQITSPVGSASGLFNLTDLLQFHWQIALGSTLLSPEEFTKLTKEAKGVVKFKDQYVYLDPTEIEAIKKRIQKPTAQKKAELVKIALLGDLQGSTVELDDKVKSIIESFLTVDGVEIPPTVNAQLRPYQWRGFEWLYKNIRIGFGSIIADDMGLGKTLQVITTIAKLKFDGELEKSKVLVVVPTTLLSNWVREIEKFAPSLSHAIYHGPQRRLSSPLADVILTTYGVVRSDYLELAKISWKSVIIDEAQNIKNPSANQTKKIKSIPASSYIAMSGTPVENRLSEYWSIMDFANRGFLGPLDTFIKEFSIPIEKNHDKEIANKFQKLTSPFLLRRLKTDRSIINDLPAKNEQDYLCDLTKEQASLYEAVVQRSLEKLKNESDNISRQGLIFQMITALKQICNHPSHYKKISSCDPIASGKSQLMLDLLDPIFENHEKVLIFTQFREMGELLVQMISDYFARKPQFLHGGLSRKKRDEMVDNFQNDPTERAFILSLKAGGTGLNLTSASHVIHYDLWWNPAVEQQATDRAYRIGQRKNVDVFRLITKATFEERINDLINSKRELAQLSVGVGEKWIGNLDNQEIQEIFSLN